MRGRRSGPGIAATAVCTLSLLLAACGGAATSPGAGGQTATAAATGAATAAATPAATAAADSLTQTITAKAGGRTVRYPSSWMATENMGILYLATSAAANDRLIGLGSLQAGDVMIQFAENTILSGTTKDPAVHLPDNLEVLAGGMGITLGASVTMTSAGRPGARIDARNEKLGMIAVSIKVRDDLFADVIAYMPPGEMAAREALVLAMIDALKYPPA
jgi:hypothetical protein